MTRYDIAIVGAGMAGASLAAELAHHATVLLLEAEDAPGYHATGRSAAFWAESYGGTAVQPLTSASGSLLSAPDPAFSDQSFLSPRGALHLADRDHWARLDAFAAAFEHSGVALEPIDPGAVLPGLREGSWRALHEPSTADIDVARLHQAYLRAAGWRGATLACAAPLRSAARGAAGWRLIVGASRMFEADVLVNAAGAWADPVAQLSGVRPLGIAPLRRTVVQLAVDPSPPETLPLVLDVGGRFYFKREGFGRLWLSPHDETPAIAGDVAADELDVAVAIDRLERVVDWRMQRVERAWAGLRSLSPDRAPVYGFVSETPGFFWFAGQGGFGIQTAPAAALIGAALILGHAPPAPVADIDLDRYRPDRFVRFQS